MENTLPESRAPLWKELSLSQKWLFNRAKNPFENKHQTFDTLTQELNSSIGSAFNTYQVKSQVETLIGLGLLIEDPSLKVVRQFQKSDSTKVNDLNMLLALIQSRPGTNSNKPR